MSGVVGTMAVSYDDEGAKEVVRRTLLGIVTLPEQRDELRTVFKPMRQVLTAVLAMARHAKSRSRAATAQVAAHVAARRAMRSALDWLRVRTWVRPAVPPRGADLSQWPPGALPTAPPIAETSPPPRPISHVTAQWALVQGDSLRGGLDGVTVALQRAQAKRVAEAPAAAHVAVVAEAIALAMPSPPVHGTERARADHSRERRRRSAEHMESARRAETARRAAEAAGIQLEWWRGCADRMAAAARKDARAAEASRRAVEATIAEARKAQLTPAAQAEAVQRRKRRLDSEQYVLRVLRCARVRRRLDLAGKSAAGRAAPDAGDALMRASAAAGRKRQAGDDGRVESKRARGMSDDDAESPMAILAVAACHVSTL